MYKQQMKPICKQCNSAYHYQFQCYLKKQKPLKRTALKRSTKPIKPKIDKKWLETRGQWKQANPPIDGFWYCHYCKAALTEDVDKLGFGVMKLTIDHRAAKGNFVGRTRKYDLDNLVACCASDNFLKGSLSYNYFCRKYYPELLIDSENPSI